MRKRRGDRCQRRKFPSVSVYYLYNAHGDVVHLTNSTGAVTKTYDYDAFGNEENPSATDANPFRYCGEYYDTETGLYYLRARYYDPTVGRFTQEDTYRGDYKDPLSLNYYTYCYNNPVKYVDESGNIPIETYFDFVSLCWSAIEFRNDPTLLNFGYMLWDVGGLFVPYLPGSYAARGIKALSKIDDLTDVSKGVRIATKIDDGVDIVEYVRTGNVLYGSYRDMKKYTSGYKGMVQAHHLLEQRFQYALDFNVNDMISVVLTKEQHQFFTKRWSEAVPYGTNYIKEFTSWVDIREKAKWVYEDYPYLFEMLDEYMNTLISGG